MYLLMLLATFLSSIYGYNLSARSDYDRDIPRKKAMAVLFRFSRHHAFVHNLAAKVNADPSEAPSYVLPEDIVYASDIDNNKLTYKSVIAGNFTKDISNEIELGRKLYPKEEMTSKIICLDRHMACTDDEHSHDLCIGPDGNKGKARMCEFPTDPADPTIATGSCCHSAKGGRYIVSYRIIDARWTDRVYNSLNFDFWRAIEEREFLDNMGIITKMDDGKWRFRGKMNFLPTYEFEKYAWERDESTRVEPFPVVKKYRTEWILPDSIFDEDFFKNYAGVNMCDKGCIFTIRPF